MRAIVNAAIGNRRKDISNLGGHPYCLSLPRFRHAFSRFSPNTEIISFSDLPTGCPPHSEVPYAFKPYGIQQVVKSGFKKIIWADCSIYPVSSLEPAWEILEKQGYLWLNNGHNCGVWTCDSALWSLGITRTEAFHIPQTATGFFGLNFEHACVRQFMDAWLRLAKTKAFFGPHNNDDLQASADPRVRGHRHEQTAASVLSYFLGFNLQWHMNWITYGGEGKTILALNYIPM